MKTTTPARCTEAQLMQMRRSATHQKDLTLLTDSYRVSIWEQKVGESPSQSVTIPRAAFNRLIRWYLRPQRITKPRRKTP
jgi:DNA polymerase III sliding clamp (beta) subunit (PCNA family)